MPRSGFEQAFKNFDSGRFPSPVWTEQTKTFSGVNLQIQPANSFDFAVVGLAQIAALDHGWHEGIVKEAAR